MKPTLVSVLELAMQGALDDVRVSLPGIVVSYDTTTQRASVQPAVRDGVIGEDGERVAAALPVITDVPVAFQSAGGYSQTFPLAPGDSVLLVFCSSSIARWKSSGREEDPADDRHHHLVDAVVYPGLRADRISNVPSDAWVITVPSGKQIRLGGPSASAAVTRTSDVQSALIGALSDSGIAAAILASGGFGGQIALEAAVNLYFATHPVTGSSVVKAVS